MLKSVGVTPKGFNRMLRFESLFYGLKALIFGLPLGLLCSYFMQQILVSGSFDIAFYPDWRVYLGVTLAVFLIVGMSMWYATSKVKKTRLWKRSKRKSTKFTHSHPHNSTPVRASALPGCAFCFYIYFFSNKGFK